MQVDKKTIFLAVRLLLLLFLTGCSSSNGPVKIILPPDFTEEKPKASASEKRFQPTTSQKTNALESAMEISGKYAKLSEEAAELRQKNKYLTNENSLLQEQINALEAKLQQAHKELNEANDLMMEMRIELNDWKADILGFRDEMREAEIAQLETLRRILELLGGEIKSETAAEQSSDTTAESVSQPNQPSQ